MIGYLMGKMVEMQLVSAEWKARTEAGTGGMSKDVLKTTGTGEWTSLLEAMAGLTVTSRVDHQVSEPRSHDMKDTSCHCSPCLLKENVAERAEVWETLF